MSCNRSKSKAAERLDGTVERLMGEVRSTLGEAPSGGTIVLVIPTGEFITFPEKFASALPRSAVGWQVVKKTVSEDFMPDYGGRAFTRENILEWVPEAGRNVTVLVSLVGLPAPSADLANTLRELRSVVVVQYIGMQDQESYPAQIRWIPVLAPEQTTGSTP